MPLLNAVQVAVGDWHTCALIDNSEAAASLSEATSDPETAGYAVKCWGANWSGQLGDGTQMDRSIPVDVVGLSSGVQAIAAGDYHTCALTNAGGVMCWGSNTHGQLGNGTTTVGSTANPIPVDAVGLNSSVYAIAAGASHTCAITSSAEGSARQISVGAEPFAGAVKCWGPNRSNQLGDRMGGTSRVAPVDVIVPLPIP